MTNGAQAAIDFTQLIQDVQDENQWWGQDKLGIWGGWCIGDDVLSLVKEWPKRDDTLHYRIWEYTSEIVFNDKDDPLPANAERLERGRLFGSGGDLSLRRNGEQFRWHFIGMPKTQLPNGAFHAENFWKNVAAGTTFHCWKESALLWGERREDYDLWFEDRVAQARLNYPSDVLGRVQICYYAFSRAGRIEFVWLQRLEVYNG